VESGFSIVLIEKLNAFSILGFIKGKEKIMEKTKKLILKKLTISSLSDKGMSQAVGGASAKKTACYNDDMCFSRPLWVCYTDNGYPTC